MHFTQLSFIILVISSLKICLNMDFQESMQAGKPFPQCQRNNMPNQLQNLPEGFVYVDEVDPTIINNLRYLTTQNFVGQVLVGYYVNRAIMTRQAAFALKKANEQFSKDGYRIVIYDSYRPQKTVNRFVTWSIDTSAVSQKAKYYPDLDKSVLFQQGYIASKSGHTRGSTVDLSIIKKGTNLKPVQYRLRQLENGRLIFFLDDNTEDFGSSFDLLDLASHPFNNELVGRQFMQKRAYLAKVMNNSGFKGISTEWWHFTLQNEPFKNTYFDFDIK